MEKKIKMNFAKMMIRMAKYMGDTSVANCWGPYHQPKVPSAMKKN